MERVTPLAASSFADLQERRRRQTMAGISEAALELFEDRGVGPTTVSDIARRSGVSTRTFFRLFATKEHSLFLDTEHPSTVTHAMTHHLNAGAAPAGALFAAWSDLLTALDSDPAAHTRGMRVRRIVLKEDPLRAVAIDNEITEQQRLVEAMMASARPNVSHLEARAIVAAMNGVDQAAYDAWATSLEAGGAPTAVALFREACSGLAILSEATATGPAKA